MADGIATARRAARRRLPIGLGALLVNHAHSPIALPRALRERPRYAAAIQATASTSTGTMMELDANDLGEP